MAGGQGQFFGARFKQHPFGGQLMATGYIIGPNIDNQRLTRTFAGSDLDGRQVGLTLIGRMRSERFVCLCGHDRLIWNAGLEAVPEDEKQHRCKGALIE